MGQTFDVIAGFDRAWQLSIANDGVAVGYPTSATLDAAVWAGGREAPLFAPTVAWLDATLGTLTLAVSAAQTVALAAGDYHIDAGVTSGGVRSAILLPGSILRVATAPAAATFRVPYITEVDLRARYDQLDTLSNRSSDYAGFVDICALVSDELDRDLVLRFNPRPGFVRVRSNTPNSITGLDTASPTAAPPSKAALTAALAAGGLVREWVTAEILCRRAIAYILIRQEAQGRNSYREEGERMRLEAAALWRNYQAQVSLASPPTSTPTALIDMDCILLPTGTSP